MLLLRTAMYLEIYTNCLLKTVSFFNQQSAVIISDEEDTVMKTCHIKSLWKILNTLLFLHQTSISIKYRPYP